MAQVRGNAVGITLVTPHPNPYFKNKPKWRCRAISSVARDRPSSLNPSASVKYYLPILFTASILLSGALLPSAALAQAPPIRIFPVGDSITDGSSFDSPDGSGGYRQTLFNSLTTAGYNVDYIGTLTINSGLMTEQNHEGHSVWTIDQN
jgi:hypothetical protein